jgi:hypothetical protein
MQTCQSDFARALRDPDLAIPYGVASYNSDAPRERFAVYRNNVVVGLVSALEARFPATRRIVGEDFFKGAARLFAAAQPPRSPLMMFYGDAFPDFLADFEPARAVPYLADVARLEAARTRAYHAADAKPLTPAALSGGIPEALAGMRFNLHPSVEIVASDYPIVTIWAMNSGEIDLAMSRFAACRPVPRLFCKTSPLEIRLERRPRRRSPQTPASILPLISRRYSRGSRSK